MRLLGLSAFQRDAAAALLVDGRAVAAAREESFTRVAGDPSFPLRALRWCLARAGVRAHELDGAVFYEKPLQHFERVLVRTLETYPSAARTFARTAFTWLGDRLWLRNRIAEELELPPQRVYFVDQARAHMAAAFHAASEERAALLHLDDVGEWSTTALGRADAGGIELLCTLRHPHSLGGLATAFARFLGLSGESELEALAALGRPQLPAELAGLCPARGAFFELTRGYFRLDEGAAFPYTRALEQLLGPARAAGQPVRLAPPDARDADLAAGVQALLEERALALAHELHRRTGLASVCLSGLLASNRALVAHLCAQGPFERVHVAPEAGKAGAALGAALVLHRARTGRAPGPGFPAGEALDERGEPGARVLADADGRARELATRLLRGERVGWARGALEFGEHSLAGRLALALAGASDARARLLSALQGAEAHLPCRLALPAERADEFLAVSPRERALAEQARVLVSAREPLLRAAGGAVRPDGRVWPQLVRREGDPELHALLASLTAAGTAPLLLLTDLALRGAPPARTEADAVELFRRSRLDALVAGPRLYAR